MQSRGHIQRKSTENKPLSIVYTLYVQLFKKQCNTSKCSRGLQERLWRHSAQFKRLTVKWCRVNMNRRKISSNVHCFPELPGIVISQSLPRSSPRFPTSLPQSSVTGGVFFFVESTLNFLCYMTVIEIPPLHLPLRQLFCQKKGLVWCL